MSQPTPVVLPERLGYLVEYCEKSCVAGCCGVDAFDFSPVHVASYLCAFTGRITASDIADWEGQLSAAESLIHDLQPDANGYVCTIERLNQHFRRAEFEQFIDEIRRSIQLAPMLLEYSNQLEADSKPRYTTA
jgi:Family of unknown function (DUF6331)